MPDIERTLRERQIKSLVNLALLYSGPRWRPRNHSLLLREGVHLETLAAWCEYSDRQDVLLRILPGLVRYYDLLGRWLDALTIGQSGVAQARLVGDRETVAAMQIFPIGWVLRAQQRYRQAEDSMTDACEWQ